MTLDRASQARATFSPPKSRVTQAMLVLLVAALVAAGGWIARGPTSPEQGPSKMPTEGSADAGFARDMQVHHNQAVEMSFLVRDRSADELIRSMALDIATTQQQQSGQMYGWLELWALPQTGTSPAMTWMTGDAMTGMDHSTASSSMPGMATEAELARLRNASGRAAEILWLELMIRHHRAGVDMAEAALDLAERPEVRQLAAAIVTSQRAEIDLMQQLLEARTR